MEDGSFELDTPRDRNGSFEPEIVKKHQSRFTSMDDKILHLYAKGMTIRDITRQDSSAFDRLIKQVNFSSLQETNDE